MAVVGLFCQMIFWSYFPKRIFKIVNPHVFLYINETMVKQL